MTESEAVFEPWSRFYQSVNALDARSLAPILAENAKLEYPGAPLIEGRHRIVLFFRQLFGRFRTLRFSIVRSFTFDNVTIVLWSNEGQRSCGESYQNRGVTVFVVSNGEIQNIDDYLKQSSMIDRVDSGL